MSLTICKEQKAPFACKQKDMLFGEAVEDVHSREEIAYRKQPRPAQECVVWAMAKKNVAICPIEAFMQI